MILIMTMNGWVCLACAFGLTIGFTLSESYIENLGRLKSKV